LGILLVYFDSPKKEEIRRYQKCNHLNLMVL
jgi:hypothetical protein